MSTLLRHAPATGVCVDLYTERVLVPRVALLTLLTAFVVLSAFLTRRLCHGRRQRSYSQVAQHDDPMAVQKADPSSQKKQMRSWFVTLLGVGVGWTTIFLLGIQSFDFGASSAASTNLSRPRVVFSFTTTSERIGDIQPVLDALVHQDGQGFDAIYVIVPRVYRKSVVAIPPWLTSDVRALNSSSFHGVTFATGPSAYHEKVRIILLDTDFGPASKVLGTLLAEHDPETVIVYGDDDRLYPSELCERALHHSARFPNDAIAVLGGWISAEDPLYCGRSLEVGVNQVSFVGGAGGVAVKRKFFGLGQATLPAFKVATMSKACFLGDDYYLSHVLSSNGVSRRLVYDSCWNIETVRPVYDSGGLSFAESTHLGGANVEHYQQCIRELGVDQDLSRDGEFGWAFMAAFSRTWGVARGLSSWLTGKGFRTC